MTGHLVAPTEEKFLLPVQLQQRMGAIPAHRNPATSGLELFYQHQQVLTGLFFKNGAGDVDDVGLKDLHQGEVLEAEFDPLDAQEFLDFSSDLEINGEQVNPNGSGPAGQGGGEDHLAPTTTKIEKGLLRLEAGLLQDGTSCKVRRFAKAEVSKGSFSQRAGLEPDVQREETGKVVDPVLSFHLP